MEYLWLFKVQKNTDFQQIPLLLIHMKKNISINNIYLKNINKNPSLISLIVFFLKKSEKEISIT